MRLLTFRLTILLIKNKFLSKLKIGANVVNSIDLRVETDLVKTTGLNDG